MVANSTFTVFLDFCPPLISVQTVFFQLFYLHIILHHFHPSRSTTVQTLLPWSYSNTLSHLPSCSFSLHVPTINLDSFIASTNFFLLTHYGFQLFIFSILSNKVTLDIHLTIRISTLLSLSIIALVISQVSLAYIIIGPTHPK